MKSATWKFKKYKGVFIDDFINEKGEKVNGLDHYFSTGLWKEFRDILLTLKMKIDLKMLKSFIMSMKRKCNLKLYGVNFGIA
ncbi:MAG: hypothetical protein ACLTYB_08215 [Clostridium paraputrificum]